MLESSAENMLSIISHSSAFAVKIAYELVPRLVQESERGNSASAMSHVRHQLRDGHKL